MNAIAPAELQIRGSPPSRPGGGETQPARAVSSTAAQNRPAAQTSEPEPPLPGVEKAAEGVNAFLKSSGSHVQFAVHQETKRMMVEVIDDQTQEVIRTIPSKDLLDLAAKIGEMVGLLLDKKG